MSHRFSWPTVVLAAALIVYLALAFGFAHVKTPWIDEGWIASAPANWATTGNYGTPSLEPTGSWLDAELTGIQQYTYWNMPVGIAAQAIWYRLLGFSIVKMRAVGILAGLAAICAWFVIVHSLSESIWAAVLTAALLCVDYTFLWSAADGRMDMLCVALGSCGLAWYLKNRGLSEAVADARLRCDLRTIMFSNLLLALSLFTHPNGILFVGAFGIAFLWLDRRCFRWKLLWAVLPYAVVALLWGIAVWPHPDLFIKQFGANASALGGSRFDGVLHPLDAAWYELGRYLTHYGLKPIWTGAVPRYAEAIPLIFWISLICAGAIPSIRCSGRTALLVTLGWFFVLFMAFFVGMKTLNYLVFVLPPYIALLSIWTVRSHMLRHAAAPLTALLVAVLLFCNGSIAWAKLRDNPFASEYVPAVRYLQQHLTSGKTAFAGSYFGFNLGYDRVIDDARLGFYSRRTADYVVQDIFYSQWWEVVFRTREPVAADFIKARLGTDYHPVFSNGAFRIYQRNTVVMPLTNPPYTFLQWKDSAGHERSIKIDGQYSEPVGTPNGSGLLLTKVKPGMAQLWYFDFATERLQPMLPQTEHVGGVVCGSKGYCALALRRENRAQLFLYWWPSRELKRLPQSANPDLPLMWSSDGTEFVFVRHNGAPVQLWSYSVAAEDYAPCGLGPPHGSAKYATCRGIPKPIGMSVILPVADMNTR